MTEILKGGVVITWKTEMRDRTREGDGEKDESIGEAKGREGKMHGTKVKSFNRTY